MRFLISTLVMVVAFIVEPIAKALGLLRSGLDEPTYHEKQSIVLRKFPSLSGAGAMFRANRPGTGSIGESLVSALAFGVLVLAIASASIGATVLAHEHGSHPAKNLVGPGSGIMLMGQLDVFSTEYLMGVVEDLKTTPSAILDRVFGRQETFTTEAVDVEIIDRRRRVAPLVSPLVPGQVMNQAGREVRSIKPAYVKDKRVFKPDMAMKRAVGEAIGGSLQPSQRIELAIASELQDQVNLLTRRQEIMAMEELRTGKVVLVGDKYAATTVDFKRDASLTIDLTAGGGLLPWTDAGSNPLNDLKSWALKAKKLSGVYPRTVHMGVDLFSTFVSHAKVEKRWQAQNAQLINIGLKTGDALETAETYMGHIEGFEIYVYNDWYVDPLDDTEKEVLPSNELVMSSAQAEGTRLYGAIQDLQSLQAVPYFAKSWEDNDPSVRYIMLQSAPLPAILRPNATVGVVGQVAA